VSITKEQLERFLGVSHPDALMVRIGESICQIIPMDNPVSVRYRMILDSCRISKKFEVEENSDVPVLAVAAYLTRGKNNIDQRLNALIRQRAWPVGS